MLKNKCYLTTDKITKQSNLVITKEQDPFRSKKEELPLESCKKELTHQFQSDDILQSLHQQSNYHPKHEHKHPKI